MRRAAQRDANEGEIVLALREVGASVQRLSVRGVPDLLVGYRGRTYLLEVKLPLGPQGGEDGRRLNREQREWWHAWRGGYPVIVRSPREALVAIGIEP